MHAPTNHQSHTSMRRLLRGTEMPNAAPFFSMRHMRVYTDPAPEPTPTPEPTPEPAQLSADTEIPEALRTQLGIGDTPTLGTLAKRYSDAQNQIRNPESTGRIRYDEGQIPYGG